jgi:large subunit ribosomal protein L18
MGLRTQKRRRRENKTDYKARRILLVSGLPRIVVRTTNKHFILQAVESSEAQDKVLATITSKDLLKNGWDEKKKGSLKSIPAGYLTGILMAKKLGKGKYIVDLGMARTGKGGRIFSVVAGLVEGGLDVAVNDKVFPSEDRLMGEHAGLKDMVENCKNAILKVAGGRKPVAGRTGAAKVKAGGNE